MKKVPLTDREKLNRKEAVLAALGGRLKVNRLARSHVEEREAGSASYTKDVYGKGSARDSTVYTLRNYINDETFIGTMSEAANYMLTHGYITEKRNWAGTALAKKLTSHCKGWQIVYARKEI